MCASDLDNVFVERLWRSVKYGHVYLHGYETIPRPEKGLGEYLRSTITNVRTRVYRTRLQWNVVADANHSYHLARDKKCR